VKKLLHFLEMAFFYYPSTIDEAGLAMYFATLLMDDATKRYVNAAAEGKLRVYDEKTGCNRLASPYAHNLSPQMDLCWIFLSQGFFRNYPFPTNFI